MARGATTRTAGAKMGPEVGGGDSANHNSSGHGDIYLLTALKKTRCSRTDWRGTGRQWGAAMGRHSRKE